MAAQASKKCGPLLPDHQHIGCCKNTVIDSERVTGAFSALTTSLLSIQTSPKRFLTFPCPWHHESASGRCLDLSLYPWVFHRDPDLHDCGKDKRGHFSGRKTGFYLTGI